MQTVCKVYHCSIHTVVVEVCLNILTFHSNDSEQRGFRETMFRGFFSVVTKISVRELIPLSRKVRRFTSDAQYGP